MREIEKALGILNDIALSFGNELNYTIAKDARAELMELKQNLKELEHARLRDNTGEQHSGCAVCEEEYGCGHDPDCWLNKAIRG